MNSFSSLFLERKILSRQLVARMSLSCFSTMPHCQWKPLKNLRGCCGWEWCVVADYCQLEECVREYLSSDQGYGTHWGVGSAGPCTVASLPSCLPAGFVCIKIKRTNMIYEAKEFSKRQLVFSGRICLHHYHSRNCLDGCLSVAPLRFFFTVYLTFVQRSLLNAVMVNHVYTQITTNRYSNVNRWHCRSFTLYTS